MRQCTLYCVDTESDVVADILEENDRRMKVAVSNTHITIVLTRNDIRYPYVGRVGGMEFETFGVLE